MRASPGIDKRRQGAQSGAGRCDAPQLAASAGVLPVGVEHALLLQLRKLGVVVPAGRRNTALLNRQRRLQPRLRGPRGRCSRRRRSLQRHKDASGTEATPAPLWRKGFLCARCSGRARTRLHGGRAADTWRAARPWRGSDGRACDTARQARAATPRRHAQRNAAAPQLRRRKRHVQRHQALMLPGRASQYAAGHVAWAGAGGRRVAKGHLRDCVTPKTA
jgi:hypothetical protein